jgi:hypothetical protein
VKKLKKCTRCLESAIATHMAAISSPANRSRPARATAGTHRTEITPLRD